MGIVVVMSLVAFEAVSVATAMPVAAVDLGGLGGYSLAFNAFTIASLGGMLSAGPWADRYGPRKPLLGGALLLCAGSSVAGFATGMPMMVAARGIQGFGGGCIIVAIYVLIAKAYDDALRPRAFTLLSASWLVPSLVGPFVSGWLTDTVSWRAVFLIVPFLVVPAVLALLKPLAAYDISEGSGARSLRFTLLLLGRAALLRRGLPMLVAMRGLVSAGFFTAEVFVPLALSEQRGLSTAWSGVALGMGAVGWVVGSFIQGRLPASTSRRPVIRLGALIYGLGLVAMPLCLIPAIPPQVIYPIWLVSAIGLGMAVPSISIVTFQVAPVERQGVASSALQLADSTTSIIMLGALGAVHAAAEASHSVSTSTYATIWVVCGCVALFACAVGGRMPIGRMAHTAAAPTTEVIQ